MAHTNIKQRFTTRSDKLVALELQTVKCYTFKITEFIYVTLQHLCARASVGGVLAFPSSLRQGLLRATA